MARTRNIKPGFLKNEVLAECDPLARILFAGLWMLADRDGRGEYRPKLIRAECLPYDDCDVPSLIKELDERGFITVYEVEGRQFYEIPNFKRHQNPHKNEESKNYPSSTGALRVFSRAVPDENDSDPAFFLPPSTNHLPPSTLVRRDALPPEDARGVSVDEPIQEPQQVDQSPVVGTFPCDGERKTFEVRQSLVDEFAELFPKLDVLDEFKQAKAWILADKARRKTHRGMRRFLTGWLTRASDRRNHGPAPPPQRPGKDEAWNKFDQIVGDSQGGP